MTNKSATDHSPGTPTRAPRGTSGGGSKKLQQLLGASESDIDLLLRPAEIVSTQTHRVSNNSSGKCSKLVQAGTFNQCIFQSVETNCSSLLFDCFKTGATFSNNYN